MCCSIVYTFQMQMCIELRRKKPFNGFDFEIKLKEVEDTKVFFLTFLNLSLSLSIQAPVAAAGPKPLSLG